MHYLPWREDTSHELREALWEKPQKHYVGFGQWLIIVNSRDNYGKYYNMMIVYTIVGVRIIRADSDKCGYNSD